MYIAQGYCHFVPPSPPACCVHKSVLHIRVSMPALQRGLSVPFFQIPYITSHWSEFKFNFNWLSSKKKKIYKQNTGEDVKKREPSCTVGGNVD